jgi:transcription initiation factor IIF auxiliary subunit
MFKVLTKLFFNVAAGQESQSFTQAFLKEETVEEQRYDIEYSTPVFTKEKASETKFPVQDIIKEESAVVNEEICEGLESNNTSDDDSFR